MYAKMAGIYRSVGSKRNHFAMQCNILTSLIDNVLPNSDKVLARYLDMACGTGDVPHQMAQVNNHAVLHASDTSREMLLECSLLSTLENLEFFHADWSESDKLFTFRGQYDTIWIMGNSLAHWDLASLSNLFTSIFGLGLKKEGLFVCDVRNWKQFDPRTLLAWRDLGAYTSSSGKIWHLRDRASFIGHSQTISYEAVSDNDVLNWELIYYRFSTAELSDELAKAGFSTGEWTQTNAYPYQVIYALKK